MSEEVDVPGADDRALDGLPLPSPPRVADLQPMRDRLYAQLFGGDPPASAPASQLLADRYRLDELLGKGGLGVVWRATDTLKDRTVAIKLLRGDFETTQAGAPRLFREAKLASRLQHPNIVTIHDCGTADCGAFVVMEYVAGRSLAAILAERGRLPWDEAKVILHEIAQALACAHRSGVVHRDLTPSNILIDICEDALRVKVIDFGLARTTEIDPATEKLTGSGVVMGTPRYISPEQVRAKPADARSDIYALGCIAYEMLSGTPAFPGEHVADVILGQIFRHPPSLRDIAPVLAVPSGVTELVARATRKNPALRFSTMDDVVRALSDIDRGALPVDVPPERLRAPPAKVKSTIPARLSAPRVEPPLTGWSPRGWWLTVASATAIASALWMWW